MSERWRGVCGWIGLATSEVVPRIVMDIESDDQVVVMGLPRQSEEGGHVGAEVVGLTTRIWTRPIATAGRASTKRFAVLFEAEVYDGALGSADEWACGFDLDMVEAKFDEKRMVIERCRVQGITIYLGGQEPAWPDAHITRSSLTYAPRGAAVARTNASRIARSAARIDKRRQEHDRLRRQPEQLGTAGAAGA